MDKLELPVCIEATAENLSIVFSLNALLHRFAVRSGEEAFFGQQMQIMSREDYLAFRSSLKIWLRKLAADQKLCRNYARQAGGDSEAQGRLAMRAPVITALIELRRAGKTWSADRRKSPKELAA